MNMRGKQIKDALDTVYKGNIKSFVKGVLNRSQKMIDAVNILNARINGEKAIKEGASLNISKTPSRFRFIKDDVKQAKKANLNDVLSQIEDHEYFASHTF